MGASFDCRRVSVEQVPTSVELRRWFDEVQRADRHENGHSYSGSIGMASGLTVRSIATFDSIAEAEEWIDDHAEKWGPALAAQALDAKGRPWWVVGAWCSS